MASTLKEWLNKPICLITADGRIIVGTLFAVDHVQNMVLQDAIEHICHRSSTTTTTTTTDEQQQAAAEVEEMPLGLYLVRGDNVCLVSGDFDATKWHNTAAAAAAAAPLPIIQQQQY